MTRLARSSGVDRATLSQIENGHRSPSIETLEKIAAALGVEVADFFPRSQPDLFTASVPQVDFAAMWRATPDERRQALGAASDDEIRRYRQSIDRALDNLAKFEAQQEGYEEQDQETLAVQKAFLHRLREEIAPFDVTLAAHASVG